MARLRLVLAYRDHYRALATDHGIYALTLGVRYDTASVDATMHLRRRVGRQLARVPGYAGAIVSLDFDFEANPPKLVSILRAVCAVAVDAEDMLRARLEGSEPDVLRVERVDPHHAGRALAPLVPLWPLRHRDVIEHQVGVSLRRCHGGSKRWLEGHSSPWIAERNRQVRLMATLGPLRGQRGRDARELTAIRVPRLPEFRCARCSSEAVLVPNQTMVSVLRAQLAQMHE